MDDSSVRYDRQIRLWGADAQQRMLHAHVAVLGLGGLAVEVIKNLVLSGVGHVHVIDSQVVQWEDLSINFFVRESDLGNNRAVASEPRIRALNPLVHVSCEASTYASKPAEFWSSFDVVCATDACLSTQLTLNSMARSLKAQPSSSSPQAQPQQRQQHPQVNFFAGNSFGLYAMFFTDLGETFQYVVKDEVTKSEKTCELKFVPLSSCVQAGVSWGKLKPSIPFVACQLLLHAKEKVMPISDKAKIVEILQQTRAELSVSHGFDAKEIVPDSLLQELAVSGSGELSAVCTVAGGELAQEILKAIQQRTGIPFQNYFVWDGSSREMKGLIEKVGI